MKSETLADGTKILKFTPLEGVPFYSDWLAILLDRGAAFEITCSAEAKCGDCHRAGGHVFGCPNKIIETCPQRAVLTPDGQAGLLCVGCGNVILGELHGMTVRVSQAMLRRGGKVRKVLGAKYRVYNDLHKITIGGFVQFREEEVHAPKEIWQRWKRKPVSMSGVGCQECREKFSAMERDARDQNSQRELYAEMLAEATDAKARRMAAPVSTARCEKHRMQWCAACLRVKPTTVEPPKIKLPSKVTPFLDVFDHDLMASSEMLGEASQ